jgi:GTPase
VESVSFVDECTIHVRGGAGGNGAVSFRREAHVPRGGPDGGDGGRGGHVIVEADPNVSSLLDLHRNPHRRGGDGDHGAGMARTGATGADRVVRVPIGTLVREQGSGHLLADLVRPGQRMIVAEGGRGGRGNLAFANRHRRLPRFAERGERVEERSLRLELKLIADVGLVGFPSAGKSSLVTRLSAARPRVAAWPFTTLTPHLGVMRAGDTPSGEPIDVVLADVPGLVEGASQGRGLGHRFLRHVERCQVLLFVLDGMPFEPDRDPIYDLDVLRRELAAHEPSLLERPQLAAVTKIDLPDGRAMAELADAELRARGVEVLAVSTVTGEGLDRLRYRLGELVHEARAAREPVDADEVPTIVRLQPAGPDFTVEIDDGVYVVAGRRVERWVEMLPLDEPQAVHYLQGRMRRAGVERALIAAGARAGDDVAIGDAVFRFDPELEDLPADERAAVLAAEAEDDADDDQGEQP